MQGLEEAVELARSGKRFLVSCHVSPDGDALGSMLATGLGLRALGKQVVFYNRDAAPERLRFLPSAPELVHVVDGRFDATFVHDAGDRRLLGDKFPASDVTGPVVVLDHHATARPYGDVAVCDATASAVGIIVARLLRALSVPLTRDIATCLWCSLVSDTGWFRYSATDVETMELATECVRAGVRPWDFARRSEEEQPLGRIKLIGLVLSTLEVHGQAPHQVAVLTLGEDMLHLAGAAPEMADGLVNYARAIAGVEVGILLTQVRHGVRASLRSKGERDVAEVAARFDGGGHRAAAGCTLTGKTLDEAKRALLGALGIAPL